MGCFKEVAGLLSILELHNTDRQISSVSVTIGQKAEFLTNGKGKEKGQVTNGGESLALSR